MRPAALTLAFALCSLTPLAVAEAPLGMTMQKIINLHVGVKHVRTSGTPLWIGDYSKRWFQIQMTTIALPDTLPACAEAEGNATKLLSLQRVGACPTVKTHTRIGW